MPASTELRHPPLRAARPWVIGLALCGVGCSAPRECSEASGLVTTRYVVDELDLPFVRSDGAVDLDGNGSLDNKLASALSWLASDYDLAERVRKAIAAGTERLSLELRSADPALPAPGESGATFMDAAAASAAGDFCGHLEAGAFDSQPVGYGRSLVDLGLTLPFLDTTLPITAAHLVFQIRDEQVKGKLGGAIRKADIQRILIPTFARFFTQEAMSNPSQELSLSTLVELDSGGGDDDSGCRTTLACRGQYAGSPACRNQLPPDGDGQCADACDLRVDPCEIATDVIARNLTKPDLRLFSADGTRYEPQTPLENQNDALSVGFSFSATLAP